jgi:hypothetical protein
MSRRPMILVPHAIEWMVAIDRKSVEADLRAIGLVDETRQRIVMRSAKRAQRAHDEDVKIRAARRKMIGDSGRLDLASLFAETAQGLGAQLMRATVLP